MKKLKAMEWIDALTIVKNRAFLEMEKKKIYSESKVGVLMLDIDFFKNINVTYGHPFGDIVLKKVASCLKKISRKEDIVIRYGGEEFCILILNIKDCELKIIAERYRIEIERMKIKQKSLFVTVTVSIGIHLMQNNKNLSNAINIADKALYKAKSKGRNCCVV